MTGLVVWWPYAIVDIPDGWHNCDGQDGTPDYRNYILIGAGDLYTPGQVLGQLTHVHAGYVDENYDSMYFYSDSEQACLDYGYDIDYAYDDPYYSECGYGHEHVINDFTDGHDHGFTTYAGSSLPPCKAGCWIQKM